MSRYRRDQKDEPELQWLEDGINILINSFCLSVSMFVKGVRAMFRG
jgi:hypothetical protein